MFSMPRSESSLHKELRPRLDELNRRSADLDDARSRVQLDRDPHTVSFTEVREHASHLKKLLARADPDSRRLTIRSLIERIELSETTATVTYHLSENRTANRDERSAVLPTVPSGGAGGTRTPDPLNAIEVLSQLSYSPGPQEIVSRRCPR